MLAAEAGGVPTGTSVTSLMSSGDGSALRSNYRPQAMALVCGSASRAAQHRGRLIIAAAV